MIRRAACAVIVLVFAAALPAEEPAAAKTAPTTAERELLPDLSQGLVGVLGPFHWGLASDVGEDARFADADGRFCHDGEYLWLHQFSRLPREQGLTHLVHARCNFISRFPQTAYQVQPSHFVLNTTRAHNSKIIFGYIEKDYRFQHGDNADLAHLAAADRVVVFFPVRHDEGVYDALDQSKCYVNTVIQAQGPCVIEFASHEMIDYAWFRSPDKLDRRILLNLQPYFSGDKKLYPGITKPLMKFDIGDGGAWTLKIERDGRDGLAGGEVDGDWDLVFTHESPGAKPFTVGITPDNSAWSLSVFAPGGSPTDTSQILVGLKPYDRQTQQPAQWRDRHIRIRDVSMDRLDAAIESWGKWHQNDPRKIVPKK